MGMCQKLGELPHENRVFFFEEGLKVILLLASGHDTSLWVPPNTHTPPQTRSWERQKQTKHGRVFGGW